VTDLIEVPYSYVETYAAVAAKESVSVKPTARRTIWFRTFAHDGFGGLIEFAPGKWRIKGVFVHREFRGEGLGTKIAEALIYYALDTLKAETLEVIAGNPAFYEARSFKRLGEMSPGNWRLVHEKETDNAGDEVLGT
jgi:GNAT superfamily N-acetyltransferase